jgi:N-methylhydantoinase A
MRVIVSEAAINPSDLSVMAYGGAGPVHASALAREMDIRTTIIPRHPGALSALGAATGDLLHDLVDPVMRPLDEIPPDELEARFDAMFAHGRGILGEEGVPESDMSFLPYVVARYIGQMHDLQVPLEDLDEIGDPAQVAARFHQRYWDVYGIKVEEEPVLVISARVRAVGRIQKPSFAGLTSSESPAAVRQVKAWFEGDGVVDTPLYIRAPWRPNEPVAGPAIIQEYDSTTVVLPGQTWRTDDLGSIIIEEV